MAVQQYNIHVVELSTDETNTINFDPETTSVNLMPAGGSIVAVLSERIFSDEEKAELAVKKAIMDKLVAQTAAMQAPDSGFEFIDDDDEED